MTPMRLFIVIDETPFFHPKFLQDFISRCSHEIVGAGVIVRVPRKHNINSWLLRHLYYLRPREIVTLALRGLLFHIADRAGAGTYSVRRVLRRHRIEYIEIRDDINRPEYVSYIRSKTPDLVISSCALIFRDELLALPTLGCINRHSALLPSYGGLWPVFHAYRSGEACTGVSVHTMERKIDGGIVLAQQRIPITPGDSLYSLYEKCFDASASVLLEALGKVQSGRLTSVSAGAERSYYSFPTREHWNAFRKRGGRFV